MSKQLFSDFSEVSSKQWKQKIQADLKGADYNDTLIWHTNEGIDVKPFYHADQFEEFPNISGSEASAFKIRQSLFVVDAKVSNQKALEAIEWGAESIAFTIPSETINLTDLLQDIDTQNIPVTLVLQFLPNNSLNSIPEIEGLTVDLDIIGHLARTGNWYTNLKQDHDIFQTLVKQTKTLSVDVGLYQNAGANMVQQLAYALSHLNEYFNHFDKVFSHAEKQAFKIVFNVAVGTNYFFEIAKLRALRLLYKTLASEYDFNTNCQINATPTKRNKTIYDYNVNMLRTTTECMSAILGGANIVTNLPYDSIYHKDNEFGERIARNQLLILKNESYFNKVDNPADGTYYIESLTEQLSQKALELFKELEGSGGFLTQLKNGIIQKKIKENALKEQQQFDENEVILLGTNKHPNSQDRMKDDLELYPFVKKNPVKTLIEPIIEKRLAETLEQKRLKTE